MSQPESVQSTAADAAADVANAGEAKSSPPASPAANPREFGGPSGPDPTRYGDWERGGRCIDF